MQYRCLLSKMNFCGDQRLKTAIELVHVAANLDQQALCEAKFILAQVYFSLHKNPISLLLNSISILYVLMLFILKERFRAKDFVGAKWDLISMLASKGHEKLDAEEQRSFYQTLITGGLFLNRKLKHKDFYFRMRLICCSSLHCHAL